MFRKWKVVVEREYYGRAVEVKLRRRWELHPLYVRTVMVTGDDFDEKLAEAIAEARAKAITLNGGIRHASRRIA